MAYYFEPPRPYHNKEEFLTEKGKVVDAKAMHDLINDRVNIGICLVYNGMFTAAMLVLDVRNANDCTSTRDIRHRVYYSVPRSDLRAVGYDV